MQVENLARLNWQATPPSSATHAWEGPNQQQIIEAPIGTALVFALSDKFRAMGVRIAVSSDSPAAASMTVRALADGREIGRTPPFKAGDQPRFMEVSLRDPKTGRPGTFGENGLSTLFTGSPGRPRYAR